MSMNMTVLTEERNRGYLIAGIAGIVAFISFFLPYYSVSAGFYGSFSVNASQVGGLLWLVFILILVSIAVSALLIFRGNTPSSLGLTGTSTANQVRYGAYALIGAGGLGALFLLLRTGGIDYGTSAAGISAGPALGFWLLLITMIAVAVGGVLAMRTTAIVPSSQAFPPSQPRPSVQSPQQQWPSQQQSTQDAPPQYPPSQYPPSQPQQPPSQQQPPW
jgi:hypothetical protein